MAGNDGSRGKRVRKESPKGRIRPILGVTGDDPMPRAGPEPLRKFHGHLVTHLVFPFEGKLGSPIGPHQDTRSPLSVVRLMDPVHEYVPEETGGLICKAVQNGERIELPLDRIDVGEDNPNRRLLDDYQYWFSVWQ